METSTPQHMHALERANLVRLARADLKRRIKAGEVTLAEILAPDSELPFETETMTLFELLCAQRRWGRTRARKFLLGLGLAENKRVGALTGRQRRMLHRQVGPVCGGLPSAA